MFSFLDSKTSSAKLSEWSPRDWPESLSEMRNIDDLLRCSICYEFFNVALMIPDCSHNYCSLCIRRSLSYEAQCPTCYSKVNSPSLRSNRVLDELVKNFVRVRTKLLEIVRGNSDLGQSDKRDPKAGQQDKDKTNSNGKRRKLSARPSNDLKSSSPHFKRQKIDIEEDVHLQASRFDEADDASTDSVPEVVEVVSARIQGDVYAQQPVTKDNCQSSQNTDPMNSDMVECPVCGELVQHSKINSHVDVCLTRTEKKRTLRSKKNPSKSKSSKSNKKSGLLSVLPLESQGSSSENVQPSGVVIKDSCSSTASTSTSTVKGSNALIQPAVHKRKPLPKLVYSVMAEKELRQRLREWNLSTKGDKSTLIKRHQDFVLLYNVQCDSARPMTATQVANEVEKAERKRSEMASSTVESSAAALHFDKDQSEEDMDKARQKYLSENQHEFNKLIADVKRRRGRGRNVSGKNTVTKMPEEGTRATIKVINQPDTLDFGQNTDPHDTGETSPMAEKSSASHAGNNSHADDFGGWQPIAHRKDNERKNAEMIEASIVPEPPSSPSLALFEEEDELTPSLGLDDKEWDEEGDEASDAHIIEESPVIKVGKRSVEIADRHSTTSESDEEFCDHQTFPGNKSAKSRLF